jgi:hypothetical protein
MRNALEPSTPVATISQFALDLPRLLVCLEDAAGPSLPSHVRVAMVLEAVRIEEHVACVYAGTGRPPACRKSLARAFLCKAVLGIPTTVDLVERLAVDARLRRIVGFCRALPSEATFSRAFAEFARSGLTDRAHEAAARAHLGEDAFLHAALDASAIPAREALSPAPPKEPKAKGKPGRKPGGERREPTRQERQEGQAPKAALLELPRACSVGAKVGSKGTLETWRGYKAHADVADGGIPLAFWTTSANLHDSQAAIPLLRLAASRVGGLCYRLMDKAYAGELVLRACQALGQVAIVPTKAPKGGEAVPLDPARRERFRNRTVVERFFSDLKDHHGGRHLFVKGGEKVHAHLMMGVLAIFGLRVLGR